MHHDRGNHDVTVAGAATPVAPLERPLSELPIGSSGRVRRLRGAADVCARLREMGLTTGATVKCVRVAPLGDPIELQVRGYRLSVRRSEAAAVVVEIL